MDNPIKITDNSEFTADRPLIFTRFKFTRENKRNFCRVQLLYLDQSGRLDDITCFNRTYDIDLTNNGTRHPDLMVTYPAGTYRVIGLIPGDSLEIFWQEPEVKPEPVQVNMDQIRRDWMDGKYFRKEGAFIRSKSKFVPMDRSNVHEHSTPEI